MTGRYGRTELYLSRFPARGQVLGTCTKCTICYGMEIVGILTNQPVVQLSPLFLQWDFLNRQQFSSCASHLWPDTLTYGPTQWLDGVSDYTQSQIIAGTKPDAVCFADEVNHKLLEMDYFQGGPTLAQSIANAKAVIDAGYAMLLFVPPNHDECVWDYDDTGMLGLDSRSESPTPTHHDWNMLGPNLRYLSTIYKRVLFTGTVTPPRINPYMPHNNPAIVTAMRNYLATLDQTIFGGLRTRVQSIQTVTAAVIADLWARLGSLPAAPTLLPSMVNALTPDSVVIAPPVLPSSNATLLQQILATLTSWTATMVTQTQIDQLKTYVNALIADGVAPVPAPAPVPSPAGTSPIGTTITPGVGSITDDKGLVWTITVWASLARNGNTTDGFNASSATWNALPVGDHCYPLPTCPSGIFVIATNKDSGSKSYWNGSAMAQLR